jgi:hypothetical protein
MSGRCASGEGKLPSKKEGERGSRLTGELVGVLQHLRDDESRLRQPGGRGDLRGGGGGRGE